MFIDRARIYAHHGVLPQERTVGAWFCASLWIECDMQRAVEEDCLDGTIDYAAAYDVLCRQMATSSQLLEHVAGRVARAIMERFSDALSVRVRIVKENPPFGANVQGAGVDITFQA